MNSEAMMFYYLTRIVEFTLQQKLQRVQRSLEELACVFSFDQRKLSTVITTNGFS